MLTGHSEGCTQIVRGLLVLILYTIKYVHPILFLSPILLEKVWVFLVLNCINSIMKLLPRFMYFNEYCK